MSLYKTPDFIYYFKEYFLHPEEAKVIAEIKARIPYLKEVPGYLIYNAYRDFVNSNIDISDIIDSVTIMKYKEFLGLDIFNSYDELFITKGDVENKINDILETIGERHKQ